MKPRFGAQKLGFGPFKPGFGGKCPGVGGTGFGVFSGVLEGVAFSLERGFGRPKDGQRIPWFLRMEGEFLESCLTEGFEFPQIFHGSPLGEKLCESSCPAQSERSFRHFKRS